MLRCSLLILTSLFVLPACQDTKVIAVKDFKLFAETDDASVQHSIDVLVNRYNQQYGSRALTLVKTDAESNSRIQFTEGLYEDGEKLGLGQWITSTRHESSMTIEGEKSTDTVTYAMNIEFDAANFRTKASSIDDSTSDEAVHLFHLFAHEIGHGLQMDHAKDISNVMYPTIPEKPTRYVDYKSYFNRARSFMSSH